MELGIYLQDVGLTIPLLVLFVMSLVPVTIKIFSGNQEPNPLITFVLASFAVCLTGVLIILRNTTEVVYAFNNTIVFSPYIKLTTIILVIATLFTLFLGYKSSSVPKNQYSEHVFLLLNALLGMLVLNYSNDLLITFIGIELLSLPLYVLVGMSGTTVIPKEASFKYFVLGSFASAFLLFGIAFIFGATQSTEITKILSAGAQADKTLLTVGVIAFLVGMFFKVALVPFHAWLPDVYQGAPTPITAFMATTVKLVIFVFLLGFVDVIRLINLDIGLYIFQWVAILTMFLGNMVALKQTSLKRMLAYSSISHSGYLFVGIVAAILGTGEFSYQGILFYLLTYMFTVMGAFALICVYEKEEGQDLSLNELKGLAVKHPWLAFSLSILLLSLAGVPPLGGFFAKIFLFSSAIQVGQTWLVVWGVMSSVIGVYYYLKPVVYMYMKDKETSDEFVKNEGITNLSIIYLSVIMVVVLGLFSQPFLTKILKTLI